MNKEFTEEETRIANKHEKMNNLSDKEENANFLRYHFWPETHYGSTHSYMFEIYLSTYLQKFALYFNYNTQIQIREDRPHFINLLHFTCFISSLSISFAMDSWIDCRTSLYKETVSWHWKHWWRILSKLPALPALLELRTDLICNRLPTSVKNLG